MTKYNSLENKVIVITGGVKNLGALTARTFAKESVKLVLHYHQAKDSKTAEHLKTELENAGAEVALFQSDLSEEKQIAQLFKLAVDKFGKVDIAINTIGKVLKKPIVETTEQEFDSMDTINNKVAYFFIKQAAKHLNNNGHIITMATSLLAAYTGYYSTYAGNKAPVEHYTRAASKELLDRQISVNAIAPGPMDTPFFYGQETKESTTFHKSQAMGNQLTKIEDIAPIIKFLVTDGWWINGQTIFANGGYTTR
ncbi:SDR family oxidoreductase [Liquorilactobacillus oeni]|uniref:Short chain dehydrogenase n=1 Tax=Liquorilactobacillus oeni DSM 19972 TaxID=1423777 RepID=A0A0R1M886_9LACO|nr:SDR family oxidoreductase [Liquorilactobacillus oeni]KRL04416.1 short chain dehydrogenase [Liquorilactobacillus oeni DSM 19972]